MIERLIHAFEKRRSEENLWHFGEDRLKRVGSRGSPFASAFKSLHNPYGRACAARRMRGLEPGLCNLLQSTFKLCWECRQHNFRAI